MCAAGEVCDCQSDADCEDSVCECADERCEQRMCSVVACLCGYGDECQPLADGASDPNSCADGGVCHGGLCVVATTPPAAVPAGEVIDSLSVDVRTQDDADGFSGTNARVWLCVTESDCVELDRPGVADLETGMLDRFHFYDLAIPRDQADHVELRIEQSTDGVDDWAPACVSVAFDGEPVYCADPIPVVLGDETGSVESWRDPDGLERRCERCGGAALAHGPMLGAIEPERARVWVRTHAKAQVGLRLSGGPALATAPVVAWAEPAAEDDFAAVLEATGLMPDTTYYYGVEVDGVLVSEPGLRFTTAPPAGQAGQYRFAWGSCAKAGFPQDIFTAIAAQQPELFFFAGDNHYGNATTRDEMRFHYYWMQDSSRQALWSKTPSLAVWDDHDFLGNNTDGTAPGREVAREVFMESWANPGYGDGGEGVYSQYRYGDMEFFLLDGRSFRDPESGEVVFGDAEGRSSLLGAAQTEWLIEGLAASTATFKFLLVGSQWTDDGNGDSWASHPEARDAIFDALEARRIEGVVLLSGDRHRSEFHRLPRPGGYDLPELTSSPLANEVRECDVGDSELVDCHDSGYQVMFMEVDTEAADPTLTALVYEYRDGDLDVAKVWTIRHSELRYQND